MDHEVEMRRLLALAKAGDEDAHRQVALYVFNKYKYRLDRAFSTDPAVSREDLETTFYEGIHRHVPLADGRGCDFYHLGQRGVWAVKSEVRAIEATMRQRSLVHHTNDEGETLDQVEQIPDPGAHEFCDVVVERMMAEDRVHVLANTSLKSREREAMEVILSGRAGDPNEIGFNKRLAAAMGVSPQRASQLTEALRKRAA